MCWVMIRFRFRIKKALKPNQNTGRQNKKRNFFLAKKGGFLAKKPESEIFFKIFSNFRLTFSNFERILSGLSS